MMRNVVLLGLVSGIVGGLSARFVFMHSATGFLLGVVSLVSSAAVGITAGSPLDLDTYLSRYYYPLQIAFASLSWATVKGAFELLSKYDYIATATVDSVTFKGTLAITVGASMLATVAAMTLLKIASKTLPFLAPEK